MKRTNLKKGLSVLLMTTMVLSSALTVEAASGGSSGSGGSSSSSSNKEASRTEQEGGSGVESGGGSNVSNSANVFEGVSVLSASGNVAVAGSNVRTTVAGAYAVKALRGAAVVTPLADVSASLQLKNGQTPYIMVFDTNEKKSPLAMSCINAAISAQGGTFLTAINVELGAKENGKIISLKNGGAAMVTGLPKGADTSKTYYVVCVQPGGAISILADQDSNPNTVTFEIKAGLGTYGLVEK